MDIQSYILEKEKEIREQNLKYELSKIKHELFINSLSTMTMMLAIQTSYSIKSAFYAAMRP